MLSILKQIRLILILNPGDPGLKLIYTTPETLNRDVVFKEIVKTMGEKDLISYLIYDDAHCISQWGNGFRPDYLAVAEMSKILVPKASTILYCLQQQRKMLLLTSNKKLDYKI